MIEKTWFWWIVVLLALGLLGWAAMPVASGQEGGARDTCGPRDELIRILKDNYGEVEVGVGLATVNDRERLVSLYTSKDGDSWTLVAHDPTRVSCVVFGGQYWTPRTGVVWPDRPGANPIEREIEQ